MTVRLGSSAVGSDAVIETRVSARDSSRHVFQKSRLGLENSSLDYITGRQVSVGRPFREQTVARVGELGGNGC
jgi:hypothetical protein